MRSIGIEELGSAGLPRLRSGDYEQFDLLGAVGAVRGRAHAGSNEYQGLAGSGVTSPGVGYSATLACGSRALDNSVQPCALKKVFRLRAATAWPDTLVCRMAVEELHV